MKTHTGFMVILSILTITTANQIRFRPFIPNGLGTPCSEVGGGEGCKQTSQSNLKQAQNEINSLLSLIRVATARRMWNNAKSHGIDDLHEKRSLGANSASLYPRTTRGNDDEYKLMSSSDEDWMDRRLRSDPRMDDDNANHANLKRTHYMLLRKGRDTSSQEGDFELVGFADDLASSETVEEQDRILKLTKRDVGSGTAKKKNRSTYLMRFSN